MVALRLHKEDVFEDLVEVVEALCVLQVFAHVEEVEQLLDVDLILDGDGQLLATDRRGQTRAATKFNN